MTIMTLKFKGDVINIQLRSNKPQALIISRNSIYIEKRDLQLRLKTLRMDYK